MEIYLDTKGQRFYLTQNGIVYEPCIFDKNEDHDKDLLTATAFIEFSCKKLRGVNKNISSYGLKHAAEDWGRRFNILLGQDIFSSYISNGMFILAAKRCQLRVYLIRDTYNCFFNITTI